MFTESSPGIIESTDGFVVNNHGHFEVIYTEKDHVARFYVEPETRAYIYSLDVPVKWDPPFAAEPIPPDRQELIKDRIVAAVRFRGLGGQFER
jgi:hypothetical protein